MNVFERQGSLDSTSKGSFLLLWFWYCPCDNVLHHFLETESPRFSEWHIRLSTRLMLFHCLIFVRNSCQNDKGLLQMRQYVTMESVYSTKKNADEMLKKWQSQSAHRSSMLLQVAEQRKNEMIRKKMMQHKQEISINSTKASFCNYKVPYKVVFAALHSTSQQLGSGFKLCLSLHVATIFKAARHGGFLRFRGGNQRRSNGIHMNTPHKKVRDSFLVTKITNAGFFRLCLFCL